MTRRRLSPLLLVVSLLMSGCATTDKTDPVERAIERLGVIRDATEAEERILRSRYEKVAAHLHSVESVKTAEADAYLKGTAHPGTIVQVPNEFRDAEAYRAWLEAERDRLVNGIASIEDLQVRIGIRIKEMRARNPPGGYAQSLLIR